MSDMGLPSRQAFYMVSECVIHFIVHCQYANEL